MPEDVMNKDKNSPDYSKINAFQILLVSIAKNIFSKHML